MDNGHESIVILLLEAIKETTIIKLDQLVNPKKEYVPLLHRAIIKGHLSLVKFLLNNDIEKSKVDMKHPKIELTPIELAIKLGDE